jgi:hypothetical protein
MLPASGKTQNFADRFGQAVPLGFFFTQNKKYRASPGSASGFFVVRIIHRTLGYELVEAMSRRPRLHETGTPLVHWRRAFHSLHIHYPFLQSDTALDGFLRLWESGTLPRASRTDGAHETLTRFWAGTVGDFVRQCQFASRLEAVREAVRRFGEDRDRHRLY